MPDDARAVSVPAEDRWDLGDLFPDLESFLAARRDLEARLAALHRYEGRLANGASVLAEALETATSLSKDLARLHAFASMRSDEDTRSEANQALRQEIELLATEYGRQAAFLRPEILNLPESLVEDWGEAEPRLAPYRFFLRTLMRQRRHVLSDPEERIMAEAGLLLQGPTALYSVLHNAELPRRELVLPTGESVRVTPAAFTRYRSHPDRAFRESIFHAYFDSFADFRATIGMNLYEGVKSHLFRARARRYDSCLSAALDADHIPPAVYRTLLREVRAGLPVLHRYFRLRSRALGIPRLRYHDLHCSVVPASKRSYGPADARRLTIASVRPLGEDYVSSLERAFRERWIDWHPTPGKRSGAYATGAAYDVHPYILLNFHGDYDSVSTLAHEAGHAMHSDYSNRSQPYPTAEYSIFVAEVASTFNEALLNACLLEAASDGDERSFLLSTWLDGMRATLFRQAMFAEFELAIHERAERGEALTGELLDRVYLDLLRVYHGHDAGVVEIEDRYGIEWAAVPHFHYDFYVYQYCTGIVAATFLAQAVLEGKDGARDGYLGFLAAGGSDDPLEILRRAGVDLESPEPYREAMRVMSVRLDDFERWIDSRTVSNAGNEEIDPVRRDGRNG